MLSAVRKRRVIVQNGERAECVRVQCRYRRLPTFAPDKECSKKRQAQNECSRMRPDSSDRRVGKVKAATCCVSGGEFADYFAAVTPSGSFALFRPPPPPLGFSFFHSPPRRSSSTPDARSKICCHAQVLRYSRDEMHERYLIRGKCPRHAGAIFSARPFSSPAFTQ